MTNTALAKRMPSPGEPLPDGYAYMLADSSLNAPAINRGDVLVLNTTVNEWRWDGPYVVEVGGQQCVRWLQQRGKDLLYVFYQVAKDCGYTARADEIRVLAAVEHSYQLRRFA